MIKSMKWLIAAFALSMTFNIFVVGVMIGKHASGPDRGGFVRGKRGPDFNLRNMVRALPPEAQEEVRVMMHQERNNLRDNYESRQAAGQKVIDLIVAEEVDVDALRLAIDEVSAQTVALAAPMHRMLLEVVPSLTIEERRHFAKRLEERRKRFRRDRPRP